MSVRDELLKFKNLKKQSLNEQGLGLQGTYGFPPVVVPDKMDYRKPIPDPNFLPDCFTALLKSDLNMISYNKNTLRDGSQKRVNEVDIIFDPKAPSDELGLTVMKNGKPFCFVKK